MERSTTIRSEIAIDGKLAIEIASPRNIAWRCVECRYSDIDIDIEIIIFIFIFILSILLYILQNFKNCPSSRVSATSLYIL